MSKVIDLGNGYGQVVQDTSEYSIPAKSLTARTVCDVYEMGFLKTYLTVRILSDMGYSPAAVEHFLALHGG